MKLKEISPDQTVKIGMSNGSCFVYVGKMADFPGDEIEKKDAEATWELFYSLIRAIKQSAKKPTKKVLGLLLNRTKMCMDLKPIYDRDVVDCFLSSVEKDTMVVIIPGVLQGRHWMIDEKRKPVEVKDTNAAVMLCGEIYKGIVRDLEEAYVDYISNGLDTARIRAKKLQTELDQNVYGMINDTSALVKLAMDRALDRLCYVNGRMILPRDKIKEKLNRI